MIEIQIHPGDIRRKVRYFFLDRRKVQMLIASAVLLLIFVIGSMAVAPSVIRRVYKVAHLRAVKVERAIEAEKLKAHIEELASLEKSLDGQRLHVQKLLTVYGLSDRSAGVGGDSAAADTKGETELHAAKRREQMLVASIDRLQHQLSLIAHYEQTNAHLVRHVPSILPVPSDEFVLTSPFGNRISPFTRTTDFHKGLDLAAPTGTPVLATGDGIVTFAGRVPVSQSVGWWRFGNVVVLNHADRFMTIYAHCDAVKVRAGETVKQGQTIATVGSSGWSTNSHLHYEVRTDIESPGKHQPVDPRIYILDYQWSDEDQLLIRARTTNDYKNFDPLPPAFFGRRRV
jgi:murein DD-endopeptidase MepM/ murein hydrolase activator NlpD